ncbi:MAG: hypothetical protein OEZ43_15615 [Gammaproteobacteria bacterium]|nr:hypothetical protein [Gammaproteobacteria bacterium]
MGRVKAKPHLTFNAAGHGNAPVRRLTSYYVIGDTSNATSCYIFSHGGLYQKNVQNVLGFNVPEFCKIKFYVPHGYSIWSPSTSYRNGEPAQENQTGFKMNYVNGDSCPNYSLTKFAGRHSGAETRQGWEDNEDDYKGWQKIAHDAGIVIVTPRNRWFHSGVSLENAIKTIQREYPNIKEFRCPHCRVSNVDINGDPHMGDRYAWDAGSAAWFENKGDDENPNWQPW